MLSLHLNPPTEADPDAPSTSGSNAPPAVVEPPRGEDNEEQDEEWSFLTQYIGPSPTSRKRNPPRNKLLQEETSTFRKKYLQETEALDRARTHLQSLRRAEERGKTPAGMAINVKPNVMEKDEVHFKSAWNLAISNAEKNLMDTLQNHLERIMAKSKKTIRKAAKDAIQSIESVFDKPTAREAIETTIKTADQERQERNKTREKQRLEAAKNPNPKKKAPAPATK